MIAAIPPLVPGLIDTCLDLFPQVRQLRHELRVAQAQAAHNRQLAQTAIRERDEARAEAGAWRDMLIREFREVA